MSECYVTYILGVGWLITYSCSTFMWCMVDTIRINTREQWNDFMSEYPLESMVVEQQHHSLLLKDIFNSV